MQVIEKVKVVPEGYNGAGMNYDGGNRRDVNGKASELFGVYIDGRNRTDALIEKNNTDHFNLYKYTRDADDDIRKELSDLKAELAVTKAMFPFLFI